MSLAIDGLDELYGDRLTTYYLVYLPETASMRALVQLVHQRWAIEQQYQELKDEFGLDRFEGRLFAGWQRPVVLTALAYAFLHTNGNAGRSAASRCPRSALRFRTC